jgi:hypothetical protein
MQVFYNVINMQTGATKETKTSIPLAVLVQEANTVYSWSAPDAEMLHKGGLAPEVLQGLPALSDRAEQLYYKYKAEKNSIPIARSELAAEFAEASRLRAFIAANIRVALRLEGSGNKAQSYHRRRSFEIIIADLFDLAALCRKLKSMLERIGFDLQKADDAEKTAGVLEKKLLDLKMRVIAKEELYREFVGNYHALKSNLQQIRLIAFNVFPPDSARRAGYRSRYYQKTPAIKAKLPENKAPQLTQSQPPQAAEA